MIFRSFAAHGYRNLLDQKFELGPRANVFVGDNAQGKTNILEAFFLLSRGRSFRTNKTAHLIQRNQAESVLRFGVHHDQFDDQIEVRITQSHKFISHNGKKTSFGKTSQIAPVILFSPESLSAVKQGPDERRRLIDDFLALEGEEHHEKYRRWERALKTRNALLKDIAEGVISRARAQDILESLNPSFLQSAAEITWDRIKLIMELYRPYQETLSQMLNKPNVDISVDYVISGNSAMHLTLPEILENLQQRTLDLVSQEMSSGQSLVGPHKHEISFLYDGNDSRFFCSQGQQRALVLALKMARVQSFTERTGVTPVLLLDDVLSELDSERRNFLIRYLKENRAQTVVTTTDLSFCEDLRSPDLAEFSVQEGKVSRRN